MPSTFKSALPGPVAVNLKGNCVVYERSDASRFTFEYTLGLAFDPTVPTTIFPFEMVSLSTLNPGAVGLGAAPPPPAAGAGAAAGALVALFEPAAPNVE